MSTTASAPILLPLPARHGALGVHEASDVGDGNVPRQRGGQLRLGDACGAKEHRNGDLDAVVDGAEVVDEIALNLTLGLGDAVEKHGALAFGIL